MFLGPTEAWQLLSLCTALTVAFLLAVHFTKLKVKVPLFYAWIGAIAIFGGALAFLLPIALNSGFGKDDDGRVLRQLILYTTGGVLGVITLGESHRKNNQEKEKNENDHTRQVYAERRSRYTKAIEQLADEKAAVRLGGIYTLVGLVDEWLADDSFKEESDRHKEGQVIVNSLCSYIRSPFPLALKAEMIEGDSEPDNYEGDFSKDQAAFREEQDIRRAIFVEMGKRSSGTIEEEGEVVETVPGPWSDFDFDFSRAPIFYPLNNLNIEQGNFASTRFYGKADFVDAKFVRDADFRNAKFTKDADFWGAEFTGNADFQYAEFLEDAGFRKAKFTGNISFGGAELTGNAYFGGAEFTGNISFRGAEFTGNAHFGDVYLGNVKFVGDADFGKAKFTRNAAFQYAKFTRNADFWEAEFTGDTDFWEAEFTGNAHFLGARFSGNAHFLGAKFTGDAYFLDAKFTGNANFGNAKFTGYVGFNGSYFGQYAPTFAGISGAARFSAQVDPQDYVFTVREGSKAIKCGTATLLGKSFIIPLGTVLFGPSSRGKNSRTSEPAKPLDNSNNGKDDNPE